MARAVTNKSNAAISAAEAKEVNTEVAEAVAGQPTPTPAEQKEETSIDFSAKGYVLVCEAKANKKVFGSTGRLIEFDSDGKANIDIQEAVHFKNVPGYQVIEK